MSEDIREQIRLLVELQDVEIKCLNLNKKMDKIPALIEELDARLSAFEAEVLMVSENANALKQEYREHESEVQQNQEKIQKSQGKLGLVKNNKEYQATLKEIEELQAKNSQIEDSMLEILDNIETEEQNVGSKNEAFKRFVNEIEAQKTGAEKEHLEWKNDLSCLAGDRGSVIEKITPQFLKTYDQVRKIVGNVAIARAVDSLCQGCHMNIPPQRYNELQRFDSLQFCPNCHRIIYWENDNDGPE